MNFFRWRRRNRNDMIQFGRIDPPREDKHKHVDPELLHAKQRLARLEQLAEERTMAALEMERNIQVREQ